MQTRITFGKELKISASQHHCLNKNLLILSVFSLDRGKNHSCSLSDQNLAIMKVFWGGRGERGSRRCLLCSNGKAGGAGQGYELNDVGQRYFFKDGSFRAFTFSATNWNSFKIKI